MRLPHPRSLLAVLFAIALFPASLSAISVYDVIRLSQEKYTDQEIVRIIQATDSRFVLTAADAARLRKEGVGEAVVREMLSRPAREKPSAPAAKPSAKTARPPAADKDARKESPPEPAGPSRDPAAILDDIVKMTKAGLSEETILAYAKAHRGELPSVLSNDRLLKLRQSGVSEKVVRYLTAIDVRAEGPYPAYAEDEGRTAAVYSGSAAEDYDSGAYDAGYSGYDAANYGGASYASYPASDYACYYGDYPLYGGVFYSYPAVFFVNRVDFFGRFHRRGHDFRDHRRDGDHRRGPGRRDTWRDRGRRAANGFDRGFRGGRGRTVPGRGFGDRTPLFRGGFAGQPRQPRAGVVGTGGPGRPSIAPPIVGRPGFSGGGSPGASVSRAPIGRSTGGSPSAAGPRVVTRR